MVWEIYGSKFVEFAIYRDAILKIVNLVPPYLSNHQEYWIDHAEQSYSECNSSWESRSEIFLLDIKIQFCHHWRKNTEMWSGQIQAPSTNLKNHLSGIMI